MRLFAMKQDRMTISFGKGQRKALQAIADEQMTTLSTVIRWAFAEYISSTNEASTNSPNDRKSSAKGP